MQSTLNDVIYGNYIICSCEGTAEETIINLLLDDEKLCFTRNDLISHSCTTLRKSKDIADRFLNQEYERNIIILRIVDREKDNFQLPKIYTINREIKIFDVVTKPEIEILHIIAEGLMPDFMRANRKDKSLKPSSFCKAYFGHNVKSSEFIKMLYGENIEKLINTINRYAGSANQKSYCLKDLLIENKKIPCLN